MDIDVALNPLRAHDKPGAELARLAHSIAGTHTGALRRCVHRDERSISVRATRDDTDGTPMQARISGLLARGEEAIGIEIEPGRASGHGSVLRYDDINTVGHRR